MGSDGARFDGQVALVTASAQGIGRAIALRLAADGCAVVVSDVDDTGGAAAVAEIEAAGGSAAYIHTDVSQAAEVDAMIAFALERFGRLDFAVNNAGLGAMPKLLQDETDADWGRAIGVTLTGTFHSMRAQLRHFSTVGRGGIVNIASVAGLNATPNLTPYGASKHGVVSLTRSAAQEYAAHGIRINAVAPGPIETAALASLPEDAKAGYAAQVPLKRLGKPEEIANAVAWLLSDEAAFVTGVVLPVDGGMRDATA